jgi:hypothetical protein
MPPPPSSSSSRFRNWFLRGPSKTNPPARSPLNPHRHVLRRIPRQTVYIEPRFCHWFRSTVLALQTSGFIGPRGVAHGVADPPGGVGRHPTPATPPTSHPRDPQPPWTEGPFERFSEAHCHSRAIPDPAVLRQVSRGRLHHPCSPPHPWFRPPPSPPIAATHPLGPCHAGGKVT